MSTIGGKKRENNGDFGKKVGLFEARVIAINPTLEEYKDVLGIDLKEESKAAEYLGESREGNTYLRLDFWLEEVKNNNKFKVSFFLEDKERVNKDETKKQYITDIGNCAWAVDANNLPDWFKKRESRIAYVGEEELYEFMRTWLGELDYRDASTNLQIEWKKLMKGNVKDLRDQIDGEYSVNIVPLATVMTREKEGEIVEYQNVYNKAFLPAYALKQFRLTDYSNPAVLASLGTKASKDLKPHERFVLKVTGEYGCKDFYVLKDLQDYNSEDNLAASKETIDQGSDEY